MASFHLVTVRLGGGVTVARVTIRAEEGPGQGSGHHEPRDWSQAECQLGAGSWHCGSSTAARTKEDRRAEGGREEGEASPPSGPRHLQVAPQGALRGHELSLLARPLPVSTSPGAPAPHQEATQNFKRETSSPRV